MGFQITAEARLDPLIDALDGLSGRRILSIVASTLTAVAAEGQKAFKAEAQNIFDRPKPYTLNATYVTRATTDSLVAEVGFREYAGKGVAAGKYLQPQIYGGTRNNKRFENALAAKGILPSGYQVTPGPSAKMDAYGNQSSAQIVQVLSGLQAFSEVGYLANRNAKLKNKSKAQYFVVIPGDPTHLGPGVYERTGRGFRKIMNFVPSTHYTARFPMEQIINQVIEQKFESIFVYYAEASINRIKASSAA